MAAGSTYSQIASTTISTPTNTVSFNSIPSTYTDLVVVLTANAAAGNYHLLKINNDTGSNYSRTWLYGNGSTTSSGKQANASGPIYFSVDLIASASNTFSVEILNINNYSNTSTYKTIMTRGNSTPELLGITYSSWRSTAAINSLVLTTDAAGNYSAGSTFSLYGITAA